MAVCQNQRELRLSSLLLSDLQLLKVQCVRFMGIYCPNTAEMEYNIHNYVFIRAYLRENKNVCVTSE